MSEFRCPNSSLYTGISGAYLGARVLLVFPPSVLVLWLGHQRWRRRLSSAPSSHSDVLTQHVAAVELAWGVALAFTYGGLFSGLPLLVVAGGYLIYVNFFGQIFLHLLTCAERYLAVVHPVTYRGLRSARGARLRKGSVGGVYALTVLLSHASVQRERIDPVALLLAVIVGALAAISFFSLSVLLVLIRPGPGAGGGGGAGRQRAFLLILAVMVALWLWFLGLLVPNVLQWLRLDVGVVCVLHSCGLWLNLPSSLVLHLLYLQRVRKLPRRPAGG